MSELGCVYIWGKKALFKVHASNPEVPRARTPQPSPGRGAQQPLPPRALSITNHSSSSQGLNVLEHLIKGLPGRCLGVLEGDLDAAVEAEGFQLQPDEAEAVVVEQHKHPRRPLGAGETMASNEPCPVKTARGRGENSSENSQDLGKKSAQNSDEATLPEQRVLHSDFLLKQGTPRGCLQVPALG